MRRDRENERIVLLLAIVVSTLATAYFFRAGKVLLYGDAVAHINIARRVVDNITPGPFQLGTVWLPLPHLLMLPFVWSDKLWISGLAGSLPSMAAYILGTIGIFRLLRLLTARTAAWLGTLLFALNPNLLYMQSTAMSETIYLAGMIWAVFYLCDFDLRLRDNLPDAGTSLQKAAVALSVCILTRYDGWFLTAICAVAVLIRIVSLEDAKRAMLYRPAFKAAAACILVAGFWLAWNYGIFGNPLEFATGPYSARAIAARTTPNGDPPYPGQDHPGTAAVYFTKAAKLQLAEGNLEKPMFFIAAFGFVFTLFEKRRRFVLLLWVPMIFYSLSIAYEAVPIFLPQWWPFSYYNVRYGLQLLPALAVFIALASHYLRRVHLARWYVHAVTALFAIASIAAYWSVLRARPICLREAEVNSVTRVAMEKQLAHQLSFRQSHEKILMFTGEYSGALQRAGIHFADVINEGNFGVWQQSLSDPAHAAEIVVATEGDAVGEAIQKHPEVRQLVVLHTQGKRPVTIYRTLTPLK
jgi:hypothetical protein